MIWQQTHVGDWQTDTIWSPSPLSAFFDCHDYTQYGSRTPLPKGRTICPNRIWQVVSLQKIELLQGQFDLISSTPGKLCNMHALGLDLFATTEIQIKKAISFTTFQCCHSLLNHKSTVMTDFVCFTDISWGRAEEACGVCWAMTDVGQTLKCISPSVIVCFGLKWLQLTGDYAAVCTQDSLCLV